MAEERLSIHITETGARRVKKELRDLGNEGGKTEKSLSSLKRIVAGIGFLALAREVLRTVDTFQNLQNQLRLVTNGTAQLRVVSKDLLGVANRTRASYESTVQTYAKVARQSQQLGISQQEVLEFTESLNKAVALSGANAQNASAGILQLGQALASGRLQGDELRSILENIPEVANVLARGLKVPVGALRELGSQGKITSIDIINAFKSQREAIEKDFAKSVPTIGQSFQVLKNNVTAFIGELDRATGFSGLLAQSMLALGNNLDMVAKLIVVVSGALIGQLVRRAIPATIAALRSLAVAVASTGLGAIPVAIGAATAALVVFGDQIPITQDGVVNFSHVVLAVWEEIKTGLRSVYAFFQATFNSFPETAEKTIPKVVTYFKELPRNVADVLDEMVIRFRAFFAGVAAGAKQFVENIGSNFKTLVEFAKSGFDLDVLRERGFLGGQEIGRAMQDAFNNTIENSGKGFFGGLVDDLEETGTRIVENARKIAEQAKLDDIARQTEDALARQQLSVKPDGVPATAKATKGKDFEDSSIQEILASQPQRTFVEGLKAQLIEMQDATRYASAEMGRVLADVVGPSGILSQGLGQAFSEIIVYGEEVGKTFKRLGQNILSYVVNALVQLGTNMAINAALGNSLATAATAASTAQGVALLAAWAPAATAASIATLGGAAATGTAAANTAIASSKGLALAGGVAGFETGGYTGRIARDAVAGVVHGQEFVMNADATKRIGVGNLEAMNSGASPMGGIVVNVINRDVAGAEFEVNQVGPGEVEIIAKRVVQQHAPLVIANDLLNPSSRTSKAISDSTTARRRRI